MNNTESTIFNEGKDLCLQCYKLTKSSKETGIHSKTRNSFFEGFCLFVFARDYLKQKKFTNYKLSEKEMNLFWKFVSGFNNNLQDENKFKKESLYNKLGAWVSNVRAKKKKNTLPEPFNKLLEEINFEWESSYNSKAKKGTDTTQENVSENEGNDVVA